MEGSSLAISVDRLRETLLAGILFAAIISQASNLADTLVPSGTRIAFAIQAVLVLAYLAVAIKNNRWRMAGGGAAIVLFLAAENLLFHEVTGRPTNLNAIFAYMPLLSFVVLSQLRLPMRTIITVLTAVCCLYLLSVRRQIIWDS